MILNGRAVIVAFFAVLAFFAIAWAFTSDEIWNRSFDSATNSIRVIPAP